MTMLAENFGDLLDPRFRKIFEMSMRELQEKSYIPLLANTDTTGKNYEMMSGVGGGGDVGVFTGSLDYDDIEQMWDKTSYFPERAKGMKVQRKLYDDDLTGIMNKRPRTMAIDTYRTREKMLASIYNNFAAGTTTPDGIALGSASHPYSPTDATVQSNLGTATLNAVNVEAVRRVGHTILNNRGELLEVNYNRILCTVYKEEIAYEIINSAGKTDTPNNNINFHKGRYELVVWDRLSASYPWFMIDTTMMKECIYWWTRIAPEYNYDRDFDNYVSKWSVYFRENPDVYDWQWIYCQNATG
uniref:Putative capsid protein n=1 Tax=viral metagenome TaxID=1070528 RepID=A0A6H2A183_9ZZZZ